MCQRVCKLDLGAEFDGIKEIYDEQLQESMFEEIRSLQTINLTDEIFDFITQLYSSKENPIDACFNYNSDETNFLKNPLDICQPIEDIIIELAKNIKDVNPVTKDKFEEDFNVSEIDENKYSRKNKSHFFYKKISENYAYNAEKNAYKEFMNSDADNVIKNWIRKDENDDTKNSNLGRDWLYILDVFIICKLFGFNTPGEEGLTNLLGWELSKKDREMYKINIRFNYPYIVWLAYHDKYLEYMENENS
jgi:hypothetical protein